MIVLTIAIPPRISLFIIGSLSIFRRKERKDRKGFANFANFA
jgi:hypothetical protein